jgi:nicotinamidase-related amidase
LTAVQESAKPAAAVLKLARQAGLTVIHTREGHEPGLRDCPTCKVGHRIYALALTLIDVHSLLAKPMRRIRGIRSLSAVSDLGVADFWSGENSKIVNVLDYLRTLMSPASPVCMTSLISCNRSKANSWLTSQAKVEIQSLFFTVYS